MLLREHISCGDNLTNTIGYYLQIRQMPNEHGDSQEVFLHHSDGSIVMHYEQIFHREAKQDIAHALAPFKIKPEDEGHAISNTERVRRIGFRP